MVGTAMMVPANFCLSYATLRRDRPWSISTYHDYQKARDLRRWSKHVRKQWKENHYTSVEVLT